MGLQSLDWDTIMNLSPLTLGEIERIKTLYRKVQNISEVRRLTGHSWRTIAKYVDGEGRKRQLSPNQALRAYRMTGSIQEASELLNVHPTTIWRRVTASGVVIGQGAKDARKLHRALRKRANDSEWRQDCLYRDDHECVRCGDPSDIVHHTFHLAAMRDQVFHDHPEVDPFASRRQLVRFIDLVMDLHDLEHGETLCKPCHDEEHSNG